MANIKSQPKPKAIFIDWYKTLSNSLYFSQLHDTSHPNNKHLQTIENSMFVKHGEKLKPWMRGAFTTEEMIEIVSIDTGIDYQTLLSDFINSTKEMTLAEPEIIDVVKNIRKQGIIVGLATDNMDSFSRWTMPALKLNKFFDHVLDSYKLGTLKSDADENGQSLFFKDYMDKNGIGKFELILIDDRPYEDGVLKNTGVKLLQIKDTHDALINLKRFI